MAIVVGIEGDQGIPGNPGTPGENGANGTNGATWRTGSGAPSNSLGSDNDLYFDEVAPNNVWLRASGVYSIIAQLKGGIGNTGPQGIPGVNARWDGVSSYIGLVADATAFPSAHIGAFGAIQMMSRSLHTANAAVTQIGVVVSNAMAADGDVGDSDVGGACDVLTAAIEYPVNSGTCYRITWGSANSTTLRDWEWKQSDIITLPITIPAGATFAYREFRDYPSAFGAPSAGTAAFPSALGACYAYGTGITDQTMTPGTFANTSTTQYRPCALVGPTTKPSYFICGDSRSIGLAEVTTTSDRYAGFIERYLGGKRNFANFAKTSEQLQAVVDVANTINTTGVGYSIRRQIIEKYGTHIINAYGVNDLYAGALGFLNGPKFFHAFRAMFPKQWMGICTIMGELQSTDGFATLGNQTIATSIEPARLVFKDAMNFGAWSTYDAVYDISSILEYQGNTGYWNFPGWTPDGTHLTLLAANAVVNSGVWASLP